MLRRIALATACSAAFACSQRDSDTNNSAHADSLARARQDSINRAQPGYVVDSIRPIEEELRRFRAAFGGDSALELVDGANSRGQLVREFIDAVAAADTVRLREMLLTPREFSDLVYPGSQYVRPPYRQAPGLVWSQIEASGSTGLTRLTRRLAGQPLRYLAHTCSGAPDSYGSNRIWKGCVVRIRRDAGQTAAVRLFGSIVERDGQFKFVNYANDF